VARFDIRRNEGGGRRFYLTSRDLGFPINMRKRMKLSLWIIAVGALALVANAGPASAKGCIKGAIVGGVAGHYAGHHGLLGAAAGCAIGHHAASKRAHEQNQPASNSR
jgi:hypothetical protein